MNPSIFQNLIIPAPVEPERESRGEKVQEGRNRAGLGEREVEETEEKERGGRVSSSFFCCIIP